MWLRHLHPSEGSVEEWPEGLACRLLGTISVVGVPVSKTALPGQGRTARLLCNLVQSAVSGYRQLLLFLRREERYASP